MALYSCVKVFDDATGTTPFTQTVTGITDGRTGVPFLGHTFLTWSCTSPLNELVQFPAYGTLFNSGIATGATHGGSQGTGDVSGFVGLKTVSGCGGARYSFITNGPYPFFGGDILDFGYITAVASGSFTITWDKKTTPFTTVARMVLVLGGDGWNVDITTGTWNSVHPTTAAPQGVLLPVSLAYYTNAAPSAATGAGGALQGIGWDTIDGVRAGTTYKLQTQNATVQLHDRVPVVINSETVPPQQESGVPIVGTWGPTSWTGTGAGGLSGAPAMGQIAFSGDGIVCKAGTFDAPLVDGAMTIDLGLDPQVIVVASNGYPVSTAIQAPVCGLSIGVTDRTHVASVWTGESTIGPSPTVEGMNLLSDQSLTVSGTAVGAGTVLHNRMTMAPITGDDGLATFTFTDTDGTAPNVIWFAVGVEAHPGPPPPDRRVIRRLRQFAHLNETNLLLFVDQLEVYLQAGVGNAEAPDPQMMLQYSKDGGETWSAERWMSAGKVGEFTKRLRWMQLGQSRDWVFRVVASDAVAWDLVEMWANVRQGSS